MKRQGWMLDIYALKLQVASVRKLYLTGHETCSSELFPLHLNTFDIICMKLWEALRKSQEEVARFLEQKQKCP